MSFEAYGKGAGILSDFIVTYGELLNHALGDKNYGEELTDIAIISICQPNPDEWYREKTFYKKGKSGRHPTEYKL